MDEIINTEINYEKPLVIYLIAGEASGDLLGARLMQNLRAQLAEKSPNRKILFYGIGGERMEAEGMTSLFPYHELSMMGFVEILPYILRSITHINSTVTDIILKQPDLVITIDSPGFCFRVVAKLRKTDIQTKLVPKFVHYVAPTVWAYKPQRAKKCAELFDHMLVLLPFEPPYFTKVGLDCTFVGHPVVYENKKGDGAAFRSKYDIPDSVMLFCLLPGSRAGEVNRHMPIFTRAISMLAICYPNIALAIAVPEHAMQQLHPYLNNSPFRAIITESEQDKKDAMAASQFAFVKSGTVAFEVAAAGTPMLITYKINKFSAWWLKRIITTKYVNLINILSRKEVIPELLQEQATPLMLASCANSILSRSELQNAQKAGISSALNKLVPEDGNNPSMIAAKKILSLLS
ncbi:MAG: lipid-A-disaccharide synthase [Pseudomonadota bacterium]